MNGAQTPRTEGRAAVGLLFASLWGHKTIHLFDWSFRASRPYIYHLCCTLSTYYDIICVAHFLHFKAICVNSVSTSIKKIIINVLKKS